MHFTKVANRRVDVLNGRASNMSRVSSLLVAFLLLGVLAAPLGVSEDTDDSNSSPQSIIIS